MSESQLVQALDTTRTTIQSTLLDYLPPGDIDITLNQALHYVCTQPGKAIRPFLVLTTGALLGAERSTLLPIATAMELIHTYSLVHDDLPAMDNDDFRRGQPTCHRKFNEATAILVGDGLQALAFEVLTGPEMLKALTADKIVALIRTLAQAAGVEGMVKGQALDLAMTPKMATINNLENLHKHKTGALIEACVQLALIASPTPSKTIADALTQYSRYIGLSFQVQDDILDEESTLNSFVGLMGLEKARDYAQHLHQAALKELTIINNINNINIKLLQELSYFIISRVK